MLFNSVSFIVLFLPLALLAYYLSARLPGRTVRQLVLIGLTLIFYALAAAKFLPVLFASIMFNFVVSSLIQRQRDRDLPTRLLVTGGVLGNIALLFYFKYAMLTLQSAGQLFGSDLIVPEIALPLAISFYTFQQIGLLVDVARKRVRLDDALSFFSFVLFFPALLAGPIVRYDETVPQIRRGPIAGETGRNILIGLTIFALGLFKKTVIADTAGLYTGPVLSAVANGTGPDIATAWITACSYTLQIYFDFSGYSDMAIGVARMLGVLLPLNFHSPLRSDGALEIWRRWHMTLGRWVQSYIFQPLSMPLARFAAARDLEGYAFMAFSTFLPTLAAMLVLGIWHGASGTMALFGLLNGIFMVVNEAWNTAVKRYRKRNKIKHPIIPLWRKTLARALTLLCFIVACVPFSASSMPAAFRMFGAMIGLGSKVATAPATQAWPLGILGALLTLAIGYGVAFFCPNTQQIMGRFEPALEWQKWRAVAVPPLLWQWRMTAVFAVLTAVILFFGFAFVLRGSTAFIYFGF